MSEPGTERDHANRSGATDFQSLLTALAGAFGDGAAHHGEQSNGLPTTCGVCPVCLGLAAVSRNHPQVLAHLGDAMTSLAAAAAALTQQPAGWSTGSHAEPWATAGEERTATDTQPEETDIAVED